MITPGKMRLIAGCGFLVSPVYRYQAASAAREPAAGDYVLELLDGEGNVVRSVPFTAGAAVAEPPASGAAVAVTEIWAVPVTDAPDYHSYRITRGTSQVATVTRSAGAPTVSITAPVADQALSGDTVQFSWSASDPDGDDLTYLVQYSTDAGASYQTIALDHPSPTLRLDRALLKGSSLAPSGLRPDRDRLHRSRGARLRRCHLRSLRHLAAVHNSRTHGCRLRGVRHRSAVFGR